MIISDHKTHQIGINLLTSLNVSNMPCPMELVLKPHKKKRSLTQNSLYWGQWVSMIGDHTGNFPDAMHEILKQKFCLIKEKTFQGELYHLQSTKLLNTKEFSEYLEKIYYWAEIDLGVKLYWPDELRIEDQSNDANPKT